MEFIRKPELRRGYAHTNQSKRRDLHECSQTEPAQLGELLHASPPSSLGVQEPAVAGGAAEVLGSFPDHAQEFSPFGVSFTSIKDCFNFYEDEVAFRFSFFSALISASPHFAALVFVALDSSILVPHSHVAVSCRNSLALSQHCSCQHKTKAFVSTLSHKPSLENSEIKLLQIDANLRSPYIPQNNKSKFF